MRSCVTYMRMAALCAFFLLCAWGCAQDDTDAFRPNIVVEGYMEAGKPAVVYLSQTMPIGDDIEYDKDALRDVVLRWGKVTISDGTDTEVLVGRSNRDHLFGYMYSGSEIIGEAGKTYHLTVEYSGRKLTASTTIPAAATIGDVKIKEQPDDEEYRHVSIAVGDSPAADEQYYMLFAKQVKRGSFLPCLLGVFDGNSVASPGTYVEVFRPWDISAPSADYTPLFREDDHIEVKLSSISYESYLFWQSYQNELSGGRNPIYPSTKNLKGNISGGYGIWCGYNSDVREIDLSAELPSGDE